MLDALVNLNHILLSVSMMMAFSKMNAMRQQSIGTRTIEEDSDSLRAELYSVSDPV